MPTETLNSEFILSDPARRISGVHHPWRVLRDRLPDWELLQRPLRPGLLGQTDAVRREITVDSGQLQAQKRCTIDHEVAHALAGDVGCQSAQRELEINVASARRLVPIPALLDAVVWAHDLEELADECWVDMATIQCRLDHLHPAERAALRRAIAIRDFHEEGMWP